MKTMKYFITLFFIIALISCEKEVIENDNNLDPLTKEFINSSDYLINQSFIDMYGQVDLNKVSIKSINHNNRIFHSFVFQIISKGRVTGQLEVVDLLDTKYLPANGRYAMNLIDLREYSFSSHSGLVSMIDLNYDKFKHTLINVAENKIKEVKSPEIPNELLAKYTNIRMKKNEYSRASEAESCDYNKDGNLGYFECYRCFKEAIAMDEIADWMCDIPVAGWASCWSSISASCLILSAIY